MSFLAKEILKNKKRYGNTDEFGIPLENRFGGSLLHSSQYLVARAFLLESKDSSYDAGTTHRLHLRNGVIYQGNEEVEEDSTNFYRLTGVNYNVGVHNKVLFWEELKRKLPKLSRDFYKIADELWWDKKKGKIIEGDYNEILAEINKRENLDS